MNILISQNEFLQFFFCVFEKIFENLKKMNEMLLTLEIFL